MNNASTSGRSTSDSVERRRPPQALGLLLFLVAFWTPGCQPSERLDSHLVLELGPEAKPESLEVHPDGIVKELSLVGRQLTLRLGSDAPLEQVRVRVPGACPLTLDTRNLKAGGTHRQRLKPYVDFGGPRPELGPGERFRIEVVPGCDEGRQGQISWSVLEGRPLRRLVTEARGFVLSAEMPSVRELLGERLPPGVVPVSPRTRGRVVLSARWQGPNGLSQTGRLELSALSRARGLPNVATGARVLLGGSGWSVLEAPPGARPKLSAHEGYTLFRPETPGKWLLGQAHGPKLALFSAAYDELPLDCARAACHANHAGTAAGRMSDVLVRGLAGEFGSHYDLACTAGCHSLGEPGLNDGGFYDVARKLDYPLQLVHGYDELPVPLKRLANVGCLGCHGPGAIPEPDARYGILGSGVCAYCHDAPPRYGHVEAWQTSRMSRADRALGDAAPDAGCADCHTTSGFLSAQGDASARSRVPPAGVQLGLGCVTCHAVHQMPSEPKLVRRVTLPESLNPLPPHLDMQSRVCLPCHAPREATSEQAERALPEATAGALWLGRGGFNATGGELVGSSVHATSPLGCLGCHKGSAAGVERGQSHDFAAGSEVCRDCHARTPELGAHRESARELLAKLPPQFVVRASKPGARARALAGDASVPPHASNSTLDVRTPLGRAAYNLLLILEDPAASVHNPGYAELLLEEAREVLEPSAPPAYSTRP